MEAAPEYLDYQEVMETFLSINGVVRVHNLRIWVRITRQAFNDELHSPIIASAFTWLSNHFLVSGFERQQNCFGRTSGSR